MKPQTTLPNLFHVRTISEIDILQMVQTIGGRKAHPDDDRRQARGADFVLNEAIIELKSLDDEGFLKIERQNKLAELFKPLYPDRPVVVLDRKLLSKSLQQRYDRIVEGPIKNAVASARKQLTQSKTEISGSDVSILLIINNGYTALDHDSLINLVSHRVRQDTRAIDGVIIAGCYYYSDGFDGSFHWPIDYVPINLAQSFTSFPLFRSAWNTFSQNFMTDLVRGKLAENPAKFAVVDTAFSVDSTTFVKPAPLMGKNSDFYIHGRPRQNSSGLKICPPVAIVFPGLTKNEWGNVRLKIEGDLGPLNSFEEWQKLRSEAVQDSVVLQPLVTVPVTASDWLKWCKEEKLLQILATLRLYATKCFEDQVHQVLSNARERSTIVPRTYVLCITEEISQDKANDISHIAIMREKLDGEVEIRPIAENLRIFHEHALALAAAYAVEHRIECVLWDKDLSYAWV